MRGFHVPFLAAPERSFRVWPLFCALCAVLITGCGGGGDGITVSDSVTGLRFSVQPVSGSAGQTFSVSVELINSGGQRAASATDVVSLSVSGGATLGGTTSAAAVAGLATFSGITVTKAGSGFQLTASGRGFTTASSSFTVSPGPANAQQSTFVLNPSAVTANVASTATFTFKDAFGNPIPSVAVSLSSNLAGATFTPSSGTSGADGTFSSSFLSPVSGSATINATVGGTQITIPTAVVVSPPADPCAPVSMTVPGTTNGTMGSGSCVLGGQRVALFRFTATGQGLNVFSVTSPFAAEISVTHDPSDQFVFFTGASPNSATWALVSGTFQFRVAGGASGSGAFSITSTTPGAVTGCVPRAILAFAAASYNSSLSNTDCVRSDNPDRNGAFFKRYLLYSTRACTIGMVGTAGFDDTFLSIRNAATGAEIAFDDDGGEGFSSQLTLPACTSTGTAAGGVIEIWASTFDPATSGAFTLTVTIPGAPGALRTDVLSSESIPGGLLRGALQATSKKKR